MSFWFRDGFDYQTTAEIESLFTVLSLGITINWLDGYGLGRRSGGCLYLTSNYNGGSGATEGDWLIRAFDVSSKICFGGAIKLNKTETKGFKIGFFNSLSATEYHGYLHFAAGPAIEVVDSTGTTIGTYSIDFTAGFNYYEIELDTVANTFKVWVDEALVLDLTGDFSKTGTEIAYWGLGNAVYGGSTQRFYLDDCYVETANRRGDLAILYFVPDSDVSVGFTPSTGTDNYALVDETPESDTDYNESALVGDADLYASTGTFGTLLGDVLAVDVVGYANVPDGGVGSGIIPKLKISGVEYDGTQIDGTTVAKEHIYGEFLLNPATGAAFTRAEIEALDGFGWEIGE